MSAPPPGLALLPPPGALALGEPRPPAAASPRRGMPATVLLAVRLAQMGYRAVPHLSARLIRDAHELGQILEALKEGGIDNVFVVAGDAPKPAGQFPDALSLLHALPAGHHLTQIGVTGYPESHP